MRVKSAVTFDSRTQFEINSTNKKSRKFCNVSWSFSRPLRTMLSPSRMQLQLHPYRANESSATAASIVQDDRFEFSPSSMQMRTATRSRKRNKIIRIGRGQAPLVISGKHVTISSNRVLCSGWWIRRPVIDRWARYQGNKNSAHVDRFHHRW